MVPTYLKNLFEGKVEFFDYQTFVKNCHFANSRIRLFIPYCLGNDFHGRHKLDWPRIDEDATVYTVIEVLGKSYPSMIDNYQEELNS